MNAFFVISKSVMAIYDLVPNTNYLDHSAMDFLFMAT
jgi:hypothetical protein